MITLENLQQYAAIQENDEGEIKYICWKNNDGAISLTVDVLENCECTLSESEMLTKVEKTLYEFPFTTISSALGDIQTEIQLNRLKNKVALETRRGVANTTYNNVLYYRNNIPNLEIDCDSPLFVLKNGDKYGVYKHPDFDKYGFVVEYQN